MMRLDVYLVEKGLAQSRERAKDNIQNGLVNVNGTTVTKPSFQVDENAKVVFDSSQAMPFVGRGGLKLEKAIGDFNLDFTGKYVLDIGASTGGFTHCALQHGANFIWAVDVGTNQLDVSLRNHPQVCSIENCDIRKLGTDIINSKVDYIVADLSFISLNMVASALPKFLEPNGKLILLIKPQFEAGREFIGKNGIVKNPKVHVQLIQNVLATYQGQGFYLNGINYSPIYSKTKNIEYLGLFSRTETALPNVTQIVIDAFNLQKKL